MRAVNGWRRAGGLLILVMVLLPDTAAAQPSGRVHRIGLLVEAAPIANVTGATPKAESIRALQDRLRELGYVYGTTLIMEVRSAEGLLDQLPKLAAELVAANLDVIVATGNRGTEAAMRATKTIPIVMAGASDPVGSGLVASLARPGGNVTGLSFDPGGDIAGKRVELLRQLVPRLNRLAYIVNAPQWMERPMGKAVIASAKAFGVTLLPFVVSTLHDLNQTSDRLTHDRVDALLVEQYPLVYNHRQEFVQLAMDRRLPAMYGHREVVELGGLIAYANDFNAIYRRAAEYVDTILRGTKPSALPVEQAATFDLAVNLKTARALRLAVPPVVLARATRVVE